MTIIPIWIFVGIVLTNFTFDTVLELLNLKHRKSKLPPFVADIFNEEAYIKQQSYELATTRFSLFQSILSTFVIVFLLLFGFFGWLHSFVVELNYIPIFTSLIFFLILFIASKILSLPFSLYSTFVIENRFGFNKTTPKLFVLDQLKSMLLSLAIGGVLLFVITLLFYSMGRWFWLFALFVMIMFSIIANLLYPKIIIPIFNKMLPLDDGSLRKLIIDFAEKVKFPINKVFVIDGSKRSTKANAFFAGFGRSRRVVIYDTLLAKLNEREVLAVVAHEVGHYLKKHLWFNLGLGILQSACFLYLFNLLSYSFDVSSTLGFTSSDGPLFHLSLISFGIIFSPLGMILGIITNSLSRRMERQADAFAMQNGFKDELISGLKKLATENLTNLTPHPLYVLVHYSHPPLNERLRVLIGEN
jgi:STE24 endopeptidase